MKNKTLVAKKIALVVAGLSMAAPCFIAGAPAFADSYASVQRSTNVNLAKLYGTTDGVGLIYKNYNLGENPTGEGKFAFQLYYDMLMASNNTRMASKTGKLDAASEKLLNSIKEEFRRYSYRFNCLAQEDGENSNLLEKHWKRIDAAKSPEELKKAYKDLIKDMRFSIRKYSAHYGLNNVTNGMQNPKSNSFVDPTPTKSKYGNYDLSSLGNFPPIVYEDNSYPHAPAPASLSDVDPNLKGNLVLDKSIGAEAGMPSYVRIETRKIYPNADVNKLMSNPHFILSSAYLYKGSVDDFGDAYGEKPVLLTSASYKDNDIIIGEDYQGDSNNGEMGFDVSIPEGCHGLYTILLVDDDGRQLGWTTINVDKEGESVGDISRGAAIAASDDESTPSDVTPSDFDFTPSFDVTPDVTPSDFDFTPSFDVTPSEDTYTPSDFDFTPSFDVTPSEDVTPSDFDFTPSFDVTPSEDTYTPSDFDFTPSFDVTPSEDTPSDFDFTPSFDVTPSEDVTPSDFDFSPNFDVTPSEDAYTPSDFDFTPSFDVTPSEETPSDFDFTPSFDVTPSEDTYTPSDFDFTPNFDEAPSSDSDSNVTPSDFTFDYNFDAVDAQ
ncbi:cellulosome anchor protein [Gardnerella vaginalis]|uniref:cellulosome anchor protein n=1 Tax=Gardnerella vaginalis TaxID=2702 RepID=UPI000E213244|nr:cellulosome anchor protein [Gardnerella vaginalis]RDW99043.1 cellulosome anchor protein [Gardnerella vaginalis]